jgi:hypothetical protein
MMFSLESTAILGSRLVPSATRLARTPSAPWQLSAYAAAVFAKVRDLAPYAAIELILPGGSLLALLLWLYRRYYLTVAAPALHATSSCDPVPPEQPIAPMSFPLSTSGIPPRVAITPSSVRR